tara:strand:- start:48 stop:581 length:534 start_codon:yes stop_codon:yes gene_type:complete
MAGHDKSVMREGEMKNFSVDPDSTVREGEMTNRMTTEEEIILDSLIKSGISLNTALDIMASNKVDSMNKLQQLRSMTDEPVRPQEFGALKQLNPRSVVREGEMLNMRPSTQGGMSQQAMMNYLAGKTNTTKNAMGNILNAMSSASPMMQTPMKPTTEMAPTGMQKPMMPPVNPMMRR